MSKNASVPKSRLAHTVALLCTLGASASDVYSVAVFFMTEADRSLAISIRDERARRDFYLINTTPLGGTPMVFMVPHYSLEPFLTIENTSGESTSIPADVVGKLPTNIPAGREITVPGILAMVRDFIEGEPASVILTRGAWWAHLSAPGYMDQTEWSGPFESLKAGSRCSRCAT